jgi:selenocysteine lyase/cysteine desulfurase
MDEEQKTAVREESELEAWLVEQLEQWPTRVHPERTTNIEYLMKEAAKRIRSMPLPAPTDQSATRLGELLSVIHRDGGHYVQEHGIDKAYEDALRLSADRLPTLSTDEEVKRLREALEQARSDLLEQMVVAGGHSLAPSAYERSAMIRQIDAALSPTEDASTGEEQ